MIFPAVLNNAFLYGAVGSSGCGLTVQQNDNLELITAILANRSEIVPQTDGSCVITAYAADMTTVLATWTVSADGNNRTRTS